MFMKTKETSRVLNVAKPFIKSKNLNIIFWQFMKALEAILVNSVAKIQATLPTEFPINFSGQFLAKFG